MEAIVGFTFAHLTNLGLNDFTTLSTEMLASIGLGFVVISAFAISTIDKLITSRVVSKPMLNRAWRQMSIMAAMAVGATIIFFLGST